MGAVRPWPWAWVLLILGLGLVVLQILAGGSVNLGVGTLWRELVSGPGGAGADNVILWQIRLPRSLGGLVAGGILGTVGACFRTYFRNPLAEPYVLGVASGAAATAALVVLAGLSVVAGGLLMSLAGAVGGVLTLSLVWALGGGFSGRFDVVRLLLAGVVIGSLMGAFVTLVLLLAGKDTNQVLRWLLGSLTPMFWPKLGVLAGALGVGGAVLYRQTRWLNAVGFEGDGAGHLGVDFQRLSLVVLGVGTAMVGLLVGSVGMIGFVGLVAPHIARGLVGPDLRRSFWVSGLVGACLVLAADLGAQKLIVGAELPVGAVTALLGAPVLLMIAGKRRLG